jgi:hypothetical protein
MKSKEFDCVEMKRHGAELVIAETASLTPEQELEYWRNATEVFMREQREARARRSAQQPSRQPIP